MYDSHRFGFCWNLKTVCLAVFDHCFCWGNNRTSGRAWRSFTELYCPMWCGEYWRSVMSLFVLCGFWNGGRPRKSHTVGILLSSMVFPSPMRNERYAPASIAPNSRRFEGFLLVCVSWVYTLATDNHLPGMRPACKQLYFLGHVQHHNCWYCATWTPTLMFSCWLCIDCLLNNWNLVDQFSKLLSNITWRFSLESSWNHIPDRSPTSCCSRTLNRVTACLLQIAFASAGCKLYVSNLWGTKHKIFLLKRLGCCWNFIAIFQHIICHWLFFLMVLPDSGSKDLWNFDHMRVILCLRVDRCILIISTDPIIQETKTRWTKHHVLFSHHPSGFSQIMCRVWLLEWYCICIYG